jgi:type I restriction enzyme S subunit
MTNKTLSDFCEFIIDCLHKTAPIEDYDTGYYSIRTPDIGIGRLNIEQANRVSEETYKKWTIRGVPQAGDLILAREAPVGNVGIVPENIKVCCGQRTVHIRSDRSKIVPEYLVYLMNGDEIQGKIHGYSQGVTVAHLNMEDIRALVLPKLPPLPVQRKIAEVLTAYDDLIEVNTRRIRILEQMAQAVYHEWFGKVNVQSLPEGWKIVKLGEACNVEMGQSPASIYYNEIGQGLPFHQGVTNFGDRYPTDRVFCTLENRIAEKGDILFSVRAPVGRLNIANKRIVIGRGVSAIRSKTGNQTFLFQQLKEQFQEVDTMGGGTVFKSVTKDDVLSIKFLLPIKKIIDKFEDFAIPIFRELEILTAKNANLRQTRDLLLPRLVSGEVDMSEVEMAEI